MAGRAKAEFTDKTKRTLAGRAGYQCSFPDCHLFLIGPHSDGENTVSLGVAAHIKGAAAGSARHDKKQSNRDRKHISNGIWMCWNHSVQIDNDEDQYSVELLQQWKTDRENDAKAEFASTANRPQKPDSFPRPPDRHRLDTDGKYRSRGLVVTFDPWLSRGITMVKLSVEGELLSQRDMPAVAVSAVQAYTYSVGLRGEYMHMFTQMRKLKLKVLSQNYGKRVESQFRQFQESFLNYDWSQVPGMEGALFELMAGDVKGTGEWTTFMIDITCLYPNLFSAYVDNEDADD